MSFYTEEEVSVNSPKFDRTKALLDFVLNVLLPGMQNQIDEFTTSPRGKRLGARREQKEQYRKFTEWRSGICPVCEKRKTKWHLDHFRDVDTRDYFWMICSECNHKFRHRKLDKNHFESRFVGYSSEFKTWQKLTDKQTSWIHV